MRPTTLIVVASMLIGSAAIEGTRGSVRGRVVDGGVTAARGLAGVQVILQKDGKDLRTSTTDSAGDYAFDGLAPGKYTLKISKTAWIRQPTLRNAEIDQGSCDIDTVTLFRDEEGKDYLGSVAQAMVFRANQTESTDTFGVEWAQFSNARPAPHVKAIVALSVAERDRRLASRIHEIQWLTAASVEHIEFLEKECARIYRNDDLAGLQPLFSRSALLEKRISAPLAADIVAYVLWKSGTESEEMSRRVRGWLEMMDDPELPKNFERRLKTYRED